MTLQLPRKAARLISFFKTHRYECYVVGGYVRDSLLNQNANHRGMDFTTNATPEQIQQLFPDSEYTNRFGTVIIPLSKAFEKLKLAADEFEPHDFFEVTTYRSESSYTDNRHPDTITWGTRLEDDLSRRDFTINALASDGEQIIDLYNGLDDIKSKVIRTVGNPKERFSEDALRIMRAIRFATQLSFSIEPATLEALTAHAQLLALISSERIRDELLKILASNNASQGVLLMKDTGVLNYVLPELYPTWGSEQKSPKRHHIYDVGTHLIKALEACTNPDPIVRLACLLHDVGKPKTRVVQPDGVVTFYNHELVSTEIAFDIGKRLHFSKRDLIKLTKLVRYHQFTVDEHQTDSAIRRVIRNVGKEYIYDLLDLRVADRIGSGSTPDSWRLQLFKKRIEEVQQQPFSVRDLKIRGNDVMEALHIPSGPQVGTLLETLFKEVSEQKLENTREALLNRLTQLPHTAQ
ncbi:MAG: CCA tRNA nucleotidyltransferase [Candidatus Roizmanbacteria bacterium]|nr:CCA tRNA nucleotidyltransferase [Candidatus Roizmanbacteria bacterium]